MARLDWQRQADWPNRAASRFVEAAGLRWHVQQSGTGPGLLLLHGTGASTHSWRDLLPLLAKRFTVIAPDLPGHAFTTLPPDSRLSLPAMADALAELLAELRVSPELAVGHSAGAALLTRMSLDGGLPATARLISLNGAIMPLRGVPGQVFLPLAKLLVLNPLVPRLVSWRAGDRRSVQRLIDSTGSRLDPAGTELYARLFRSRDHVRGVLGMMANWDLPALCRDLPALRPALTLMVGDDDAAVPPSDAYRVRRLVPDAEIRRLPGLGHLAHEERPELVAALIASAG